MYLYLGLFNKQPLEQGQYALSEGYIQGTLQLLPAYKELSQQQLEGCIAYFVKRDDGELPAYKLELELIEATEQRFACRILQAEPLEDLPSGKLNDTLYWYIRKQPGLPEDFKYKPLVIPLLTKEEFDRIRLPVVSMEKTRDLRAQLQSIKGRAAWSELDTLFANIEALQQRSECWQNYDLLFDLGFIWGKCSELQKGQEQTKAYLQQLKQYRQFSEAAFLRCLELQPDNFRAYGSLGYEHQRAYGELTMQHGRRDGNAKEELKQAESWYRQALERNAKSIKDHYRLAYLLTKKLDNLLFTNGQVPQDECRQVRQDIEKHFGAAICLYEDLASDKRSYYKNDYTKACYNYGKYCLGQVYKYENEYLCALQFNSGLLATKSLEAPAWSLDYLRRAYILFEKTFKTETGCSALSFELKALQKEQARWNINPADMLYRLGSVFMQMLVYKLAFAVGSKDEEYYARQAEQLLQDALEVFKFYKRARLLNVKGGYIEERLVKLRILAQSETKAEQLLGRYKDGYIKNTLGWAYYCAGKQEEALKVWQEAAGDKYNLQGDVSKALLCLGYQESGNEAAAETLLQVQDSLSSSAKALLEKGFGTVAGAAKGDGTAAGAGKGDRVATSTDKGAAMPVANQSQAGAATATGRAKKLVPAKDKVAAVETKAAAGAEAGWGETFGGTGVAEIPADKQSQLRKVAAAAEEDFASLAASLDTQSEAGDAGVSDSADYDFLSEGENEIIPF